MSADKKEPIFVTRPLLPPLDEYVPLLKDIWERKWLTNNGHYHQELEKALCIYLGVSHISLFSNGTLALITALQALEVEGEVITTPFSFVATAHAIKWNRCTPVFADIDPRYGNLDPAALERAITPQTRAILPVHVYGNPCDTVAIADIVQRHKLKVIYDAAHAFGVRRSGRSLLRDGDLSVLSFHATKVFGTFEGGAIVSHSEEMKQKIDSLKSFGFTDETTVSLIGMNAKMNEAQAAFGLLALNYVDAAIAQRRALANGYCAALEGIPGIRVIRPPETVEPSWTYFPILIDEAQFGKSRDAVFDALKNRDIFARRYFYPLISRFPVYSDLPSARPAGLPVAERLAAQVLCLPIYPELTAEEQAMVCDTIKSLAGR